MPSEEQIRQAYNEFPPEARDMPYSEFRKEILALTDPAKIRRDLAAIQAQKARGRSTRLRIDRGMKGGS
jgi:hypothetical protein